MLLNISENILIFISATGIIQALVLTGLLLFHPKIDRAGNRFLACFVFCISVPMIMPVIKHLFSWQAMLLVDPLAFLIGPSLYLYVCSFRKIITWQRIWPHLILSALSIYPDYSLYAVVVKQYPISSTMPQDALVQPIAVAIICTRITQLLVYYFLSLRELKSYQRSVSQLFSETSQLDLRWVKWLINGYIFLVLALMIGYSLVFRYPEQVDVLILSNTALIAPYIYIATVKGLVQPTLWQVQPGKDKKQIEEELQTIGFIGTGKHIIAEQPGPGKTDERLEAIITRVLTLMEQEELYKEPLLTLQNMADRLQCPAYQVSQAINEGLEKNFYDLINGYRVEEAKRLLLDIRNLNYTVLSVGFDAGFNSKTTFNTVFKKFTGLTPTEFRTQHSVLS